MVSMLRFIQLDYRNNTIMFDMVEVPEEGEGVYKLFKRIKPRNKN